MIKNKLIKILTLNGISVIIGVSGGLLGFVSILITDYNLKISLKWLVFVIFLFFTFLLISFKLSYELYLELKTKKPNTSKAIRYLESNSILLVENNDFLDFSGMTSIFFLDRDIEIEVGQGYVLNVQEKFTQIKILSFDENFQQHHTNTLRKLAENNNEILKNIIIKSYIRYTN
jgi:hypothetical protein